MRHRPLIVGIRIDGLFQEERGMAGGWVAARGGQVSDQDIK